MMDHTETWQYVSHFSCGTCYSKLF